MAVEWTLQVRRVGSKPRAEAASPGRRGDLRGGGDHRQFRPQAPLPWQSAEPEHSFCGSAQSIALQKPSPRRFQDPSHDLQRPVHAESQQKPSVQKPVAQSDDVAHMLPCGSFMHAPAPLQIWLPVHSFAGS